MSPKMRLTVTRPSTSTTPTRACRRSSRPRSTARGSSPAWFRRPHRVRPTPPSHAASSSPAGTAEPVRTLSSVWRKRQGLRWVPNTSTARRTPTGSVSGSLKLRMTMSPLPGLVGDLVDERRQPQHEPQPERERRPAQQPAPGRPVAAHPHQAHHERHQRQGHQTAHQAQVRDVRLHAERGRAHGHRQHGQVVAQHRPQRQHRQEPPQHRHVGVPRLGQHVGPVGVEQDRHHGRHHQGQPGPALADRHPQAEPDGGDVEGPRPRPAARTRRRRAAGRTAPATRSSAGPGGCRCGRRR